MRKITNEELNRPSAGEFAAMEKMPVTVVLDNVRSLQNVGAFFRTGDAFAVERIALCGITATPPNRDIHKTALGAELTVPWTYHKTTEECIARLRAEGYRVYAVAQWVSCKPFDSAVINTSQSPILSVSSRAHFSVKSTLPCRLKKQILTPLGRGRMGSCAVTPSKSMTYSCCPVVSFTRI